MVSSFNTKVSPISINANVLCLPYTHRLATTVTYMRILSPACSSIDIALVFEFESPFLISFRISPRCSWYRLGSRTDSRSGSNRFCNGPGALLTLSIG